MKSSSSQQKNLRIVLYSHDTMGLGHVRRNLLIAQAFSKSHFEPDILLMTGIPEAARFSKPTGVDCIVLPSLYKEQDGAYRSRHLRIPLREIIELRRQILYTSISTFNPNVLIVDGVPWGAVNELDLTLEYLRQKGNTICILGMRDVWDEPSVIRREWDQRRNNEAIRRYYSQIWIYGDSAVYNAVQEYRLPPDTSSKVVYTGYLNSTTRLDSELKHEKYSADLSLPNGPFVLCITGGGQDGIKLTEAFINAELPAVSNAIVVTGPHMDSGIRRRLHRITEGNKRITLIDFVSEPSLLMQYADCVISMGGYNTICEIMSFGKRALVVPRVIPRKEQLIRAQRLHELGMIDILHPDDLAPAAITKWLQDNMGKPAIKVQTSMNGLTQVTQLLESLVMEENFTQPNSGLSGGALR
jgi:predicted glycosyltransferase